MPRKRWIDVGHSILLATALLVAAAIAALSPEFLGSSIFAACVIVALVDPTRVDILIPVLGACVAISVGKEREKCWRDSWA